MFYKKAILFLVLFFLALSLYGFAPESYGIKAGIMYIRNSHKDSAPSPVLPFLGVKAYIPRGNNFYLAPSITFNLAEYFWSEDDRMALPAEIEYADAVLLLNFIIDCPFVLKTRINDDVTLGGFIAPTIILRFPVRTHGAGEEHRSDILTYFYAGRFFFLGAGGLVKWDHSPRNSLTVRIDTLLPVFNLFNNDPLAQQLSIRGSLTFSFKTRRAMQEKAAAQSSAQVAEIGAE
ncbi:MAG: hypothetical protein FWC36_03380 [Spirochaetes bacterium]|nr:hypothetical protein [Spirochaetota bacterium]